MVSIELAHKYFTKSKSYQFQSTPLGRVIFETLKTARFPLIISTSISCPTVFGHPWLYQNVASPCVLRGSISGGSGRFCRSFFKMFIFKVA